MPSSVVQDVTYQARGQPRQAGSLLCRIIRKGFGGKGEILFKGRHDFSSSNINERPGLSAW